MLAGENIGIVLGIKLNCTYDNLRFVPLSPALEVTTALAWKKKQIFSTATAEFIDFAKEYLKSIDLKQTLTDG